MSMCKITFNGITSINNHLATNTIKLQKTKLLDFLNQIKINSLKKRSGSSICLHVIAIEFIIKTNDITETKPSISRI